MRGWVPSCLFAVCVIGCPTDETDPQGTPADTAAAGPDVVSTPPDSGLDTGTGAMDIGGPDATTPDDTAGIPSDVAAEDVGSDLGPADTGPGDVLEPTDVSDVSADTLDTTDTPDDTDVGEPALEGPLAVLDLTGTQLTGEFPLGVSAGAARANSLTVLTKYVGEGDVTVRVWRELEDDDQVVLAFEETLAPVEGYVKRRIEGLLADRQYRYAFFVADGRSPIGSVRTALGPGSTRPLTFAATSCTKNTFAPFPALSRMAEEPIDGTIHVGDISYNDGATTVAAYRDKWAQTLGTDGYRDLFGAAGLYATWDDHEVENNWDPETIDPVKLTAAVQSYFETLPNEMGDEGQLWDSYAWGDAVEIFILDCRGERLPSTALSDNPQYISPAQLDWLTTSLLGSSAHFKLIMTSVPITDMPFWYFGEGDRWEGYVAQRTALLEFIAQQSITGVWFLGGDFHIGFVSTVDPPGGLAANLHEVAVGPGGNFNPAGLIPFPPEQFSFSHGDPAAATWLTFDAEKDTVRVRFESTVTGATLLDQEFPGSL